MEYVKNTLGLSPYVHCFQLTKPDIARLIEEDRKETIPVQELREWLEGTCAGPFLITGSTPGWRTPSEHWVMFTDDNDAFHFRMRFS
jgi:hypothetical protein